MKPRKKRDLTERFEEKYIPEPNSGCWLWLGFVDRGYGAIFANGKRTRAHRFSYFHYHGEFDLNLLVCHKCDNPSCVNPRHLFLGTVLDNARDRDRKGRLNTTRGESKGTATLSNKIIKEIRSKYSSGVLQADLAKTYKITQPTVSKIVNRKRWQHL